MQSILCKLKTLLAVFYESRKGYQLLRIMRITAIILLSGCLHVAGNTVAQKVTFSFKDVSGQHVLRELGQQTGISIIYNEKIFEGTKPVSIQVKDATIKEVLELFSKSFEIEYTIEKNKIVIKKAAVSGGLNPRLFSDGFSDRSAPPIRGLVKDSSGAPLCGSNHCG